MIIVILMCYLLEANSLFCNAYVDDEGLDLRCENGECVLNGKMDFYPQINGRTICVRTKDRNGSENSVILGLKRVSSWSNTLMFRESHTSNWEGVIEKRKICNGQTGCLGTCCSNCMKTDFLLRGTIVSGENDFYGASSNINCEYGCVSYGGGTTCAGCTPSSGSCLYSEWFPRPMSSFAEIFMNNVNFMTESYNDYELYIVDTAGNEIVEYFDTEVSGAANNYVFGEFGENVERNVFGGKKLVLREDGKLALDSDVLLSKGHSGDLLFNRASDGGVFRNDMTYDREICKITQTADDVFLTCQTSGLNRLFFDGSSPVNDWGNPFVFEEKVCEVFYSPNYFPTGSVAMIHCTSDTSLRTGVELLIEGEPMIMLQPEFQECVNIDVGDISGCWACLSGVKVWIRLKTCSGGIVAISSEQVVIATPTLQTGVEYKDGEMIMFVEENNIDVEVKFSIGDKSIIVTVPVRLDQYEAFDNGTVNLLNKTYVTNIYGFVSVEADGLNLGEVIGIVIGAVSFFVMFTTSVAFYIKSQEKIDNLLI